MKKTLLHALVTGALLTGAAHAAAAEETPPAPPAPETKRLERFLSVGVGAQSVSFDAKLTSTLPIQYFPVENITNVTLYGAKASFGSYFPTNHPVLKNILLTLDVGVFFGDRDNTNFIPIIDESNPYTPPDGLLLTGGIQRERLNLTLKRKRDYFTVPVLLTLAYDFRFRENFSVRVGPSLGFTFVSVKEENDLDFIGGVEIYNAVGDFLGETNKRQEKRKISQNGDKTIFTYGGSLGATWNITQNFALDLQYRISGNTQLSFGVYTLENIVIHQGTLAAVWRF